MSDLHRLRALLANAERELRSLQEKLHMEDEIPVRYPSIDLVMRVVGERFQISRQAMVSERRWYRSTRARHIAMYLCREMTSKSLAQIGRMMGNRDHTTVMHGANKIERELKTDLSLVAEIQKTAKIIEARHAEQESALGAAAGQNRQPDAAASSIQEGA